MHISKKIFQTTALCLALYCILNVSTAYFPSLLNRSITNQIHYIDQQLLHGQDLALQSQYPEGCTFANALVALSLIELAELNPRPLQIHASIIDRCINRLLSAQNKANFHADLPLPYGAFYNGWTNYVLKAYLLSPLFEHSAFQAQFSTKYESITDALLLFQTDKATLLQTYHGSTWPADNLVCMASLPAQHQATKDLWLQAILHNSADSIGLINHHNPDRQLARGSSSALMLYFLADIDSLFARAMNQKFKSHFESTTLGFTCVREYLGGGESDFDSGPILVGYGSVATLMNIKTQTQYGSMYKWSWGILNGIGLPINLFGGKSYLFQQELMFDIFMLWVAVSLLGT